MGQAGVNLRRVAHSLPSEYSGDVAHYADAKPFDMRGTSDRLPALPLDPLSKQQEQHAFGADRSKAHVRDFSLRPYPRQLECETLRKGLTSALTMTIESRHINGDFD